MNNSSLIHSLKNSLFKKETHDAIKAHLEKSFGDNIDELRAELDEEYFLAFSTEEFKSNLEDILDQDHLKKISSMGFEFIHLVENFLFLAYLHESYLNGENEEGEFEILDYWQDTIFNQSFMDLYEKSQDEVECSLKLRHILENQILSFYFLHLNQDLLQKGTLLYPISYDHGDYEDRVYLGENHNYLALNQKSNPIEVFPNIPIHYVPPHKKFVEVDMGTKVISQDVQEIGPALELENKKLYIHPSSKEFADKEPELFSNIKKALGIIKEASPDCYQTFSSFTSVIVPIADPSIVSYSNQYLPGYSTINLEDRDFVDLLDDLIHENGHHYLNYCLNQEDLINEDDEQIFYSPWRKSLRPIRGIYHAAFTFFWAVKLFADLSQSLLKEQTFEFSKAEQIKIHRRFLEEFFMVDFCHDYLQWSFEKDKVTETGHQLIIMIYEEMGKLSGHYEEVKKHLSETSQEDLKRVEELEQELQEKKSHYRLS